MRFALLASGLPLAAAMATDMVHRRAAPSVLVSLFVDKATDAISLMVTDEAKAKIYAHGCASTLALGSLNIAYDVDLHGSGTLQFGSTAYKVHSNPTVSGGIKCGVIYDDSETHVECLAPWPAGSELVELPTNATQPCFENHLSRRATYDSDEGTDAPLVPRDLHHDAPAGQSKRQVTCMPVPVSRLVGNGNPHQNFQHTQLSQNLECKSSVQCTVGRQESKSYSIGWQASAAVPWISGGFAVQQSWTTGNSYECSGGKWETVCVKYRTAMTAYTINKGSYWACNGATIWDAAQVIIWSPNQNNKGGSFYCMTGAGCKYQGQKWLQTAGSGVRAGGP